MGQIYALGCNDVRPLNPEPCSSPSCRHTLFSQSLSHPLSLTSCSVFHRVVLCLFICIYTDTKLTCFVDSFPGDWLWGSRFQLCYLSLFHLSVSFCDAHIPRLFSNLCWRHTTLLVRHKFPKSLLFISWYVDFLYIYVNFLIFLIKSIQIH